MTIKVTGCDNCPMFHEADGSWQVFDECHHDKSVYDERKHTNLFEVCPLKIEPTTIELTPTA